ncbi:MAG: hypothetical protein COA65_08660 [Rhodospirillaceae bacterium]|nr:MAG: hypothetical protein COA65_08660 [Rhodospirillaceae bacterium]
MGMEEKIDRLIECQGKMRKDVHSIKVVLAGDEFGNNGLVKDHTGLKEKFYLLRDKVSKIMVIGTVLITLIGLFVTLLNIFA